jgi:hypothetical protein
VVNYAHQFDGSNGFLMFWDSGCGREDAKKRKREDQITGSGGDGYLVFFGLVFFWF